MVRYPNDIQPRLVALLEALRADADFATMRLTLSSVIKMALLDGLERFEKRYRLKP
jgi:hypothetical protein